MRKTGGLALVAAAAMLGAGGDAAGGALTPGEWQVHEIGSRAAPVSVCVRDAARLVQWRHPGQACTHTPIGGGAGGRGGGRTTIYYSCARGGEGQTILTVENPGLVRIQTQGMAGGQPFDLDLEARRVGACRTGLAGR